jgi:hypothetical protein
MDKMDRLIAKIPEQKVPPMLAHRICANFRQRHRANIQIHISISFLMILTGACLTVPQLVNQGIPFNLPASGMSLAQNLLVMFMDLQSLINGLGQSFTSYQTQVTGFFGITTWLGFVFLAAGALAGIGSLLQPRN